MALIKEVPFYQVNFDDGFWKQRYYLNADSTIPQVYARFKETNRFAVISRFWQNPFVKPHIFYDSDTAKWIEASAYLLKTRRADYPELEKLCDKIINQFAKLQNHRGYVNSYYQRVPKIKFSNRNNHELYCAGHLIEAAIAYEDATGKDTLMKVVTKYADYIIKRFTVRKNTAFSTPGHEEIELSLFKLYEATGEIKYKQLAEFFINNRHKDSTGRAYSDVANQTNKPVRELISAEGHAVRAMYLYSAMADMARLNDDKEMLSACKTLWKDVLTKTYITGGLGSTRLSESIVNLPYDLPNSTAYSESCACIGLLLFAHRMQLIDNNPEYAETIERILYNNFLSGVSLDGKSFFYENPLEINLSDTQKYTSVKEKPKMAITQRQEVFGCSCCPPNVARAFASVGNYFFTQTEKTLILQQYANCTLNIGNSTIKVITDYPIKSGATIIATNYDKPNFTFRVLPFAKNLTVKLNDKLLSPKIENGYITISASKGFTLNIEWQMQPALVYCNPLSKDNVGKVALSYGPVIYCLESFDNGDLSAIGIDDDSKITLTDGDLTMIPNLIVDGYVLTSTATYSYNPPDKNPIKLKFIPYFAFANRGESDMRIYIAKL